MDHPEFQQLIPSKSQNLQGIAQARYPDIQDKVFGDLLTMYSDLTGKSRKYPYCKLEYLTLLRGKCGNKDWVKTHTKQLISVYFALIFDRSLLFAQTRELTTASTMIPYRVYMTNGVLSQPTKDVIGEAAQELEIRFGLSCIAGDTAISKDAFKSMLDVIQKRLYLQKGRPKRLIEVSARIQNELSYRGKDEDYELWSGEHTHRLYSSLRVLGEAASFFYQKNISPLGIAEDLWIEMTTRWLRLLDSWIEMRKTLNKSYRPYFLPNQWGEFQNLQAKVESWSKELFEILSYKGSGDFRDQISIPNKYTVVEKIKTFASGFNDLLPDRTSEDGISAKAYSILFLLRTHLHPVLRKGGVNYSKVPLERSGMIEEGKRYFDEIEWNISQCLLYTPRDLLSIDHIHIKPEDLERKLPDLDLCVKEELEKERNIPADIIEAYGQIFINPVLQKDTLKELLQKVAARMDWSNVPLREAVNQFSYFAQKERCISVWKECLVEYRLMQCLVERGYRDLREITRELFRTWGDF